MITIIKAIKFYRTLTLPDFFRKILRYFCHKKLRLSVVYRSFASYIYFKRWDVKIGRNVTINVQSFDIEIDEGFELYNNCVIEIGHNAKLKIGKACLFSYGVVLQCMQNVQIGNYVQLGEYSSIRDTSHAYPNISMPIKYQVNVSKSIVIGDDVWIGKGCIILPGTKVGKGVIIGANSVVKGELKDFGVYVGAPAKFVKSRI